MATERIDHIILSVFQSNKYLYEEVFDDDVVDLDGEFDKGVVGLILSHAISSTIS